MYPGPYLPISIYTNVSYKESLCENLTETGLPARKLSHGKQYEAPALFTWSTWGQILHFQHAPVVSTIDHRVEQSYRSETVCQHTDYNDNADNADDDINEDD